MAFYHDSKSCDINRNLILALSTMRVDLCKVHKIVQASAMRNQSTFETVNNIEDIDNLLIETIRNLCNDEIDFLDNIETLLSEDEQEEITEELKEKAAESGLITPENIKESYETDLPEDPITS